MLQVSQYTSPKPIFLTIISKKKKNQQNGKKPNKWIQMDTKTPGCHIINTCLMCQVGFWLNRHASCFPLYNISVNLG